jgi:histidyl-tRNA synthetase
MLAEAAPLVASSAVGEAGLAELAAIDAMLAATGYGVDRVAFDPTVVRGLAYYTGPVFEAELTFEVTDESGQRQRFGSVAGGGRYDTLVERFLGRIIPATGASIGIDRLAAALAALGSGPVRDVPGVLVLVMERERIADSFALAAEIRRGGIPAEVFMGEGGMRAQLKYADRRRLRLAVIVGEDERARGEVAIKDLGRGRLLATQISDRDEWRRGQPAQVSVARERLLAALAEMLATEP